MRPEEILARLVEITNRVNAATPGPYEAYTVDGLNGGSWDIAVVNATGEFGQYIASCSGFEDEEQNGRNADFFAHIRSDAPWMLNLIYHLVQRVNAVETQLKLLIGEDSGDTGRPE
jgi:hypothetical protein